MNDYPALSAKIDCDYAIGYMGDHVEYKPFKFIFDNFSINTFKFEEEQYMMEMFCHEYSDEDILRMPNLLMDNLIGLDIHYNNDMVLKIAESLNDTNTIEKIKNYK